MPTACAPPVPITILLADDDHEDRELTRRALDVAGAAQDVRTVSDGDELMSYLRRRGPFAQADSAPRPDLLLLDLRMPKKDGFECLLEIRLDPALRRLPVVILTSSRAEHDVERAYDLGVNSFITKSPTFFGLVDAMRAFTRFWFEVVSLPETTTMELAS